MEVCAGQRPSGFVGCGEGMAHCSQCVGIVLVVRDNHVPGGGGCHCERLSAIRLCRLVAPGVRQVAPLAVAMGFEAVACGREEIGTNDFGE